MTNELEQALEVLELADAALSGANMNMNVVEKKVKQALKQLKAVDVEQGYMPEWVSNVIEAACNALYKEGYTNLEPQLRQVGMYYSVIPDTITVNQEQWDELNEILDRPARELPEIKKLLQDVPEELPYDVKVGCVTFRKGVRTQSIFDKLIRDAAIADEGE